MLVICPSSQAEVALTKEGHALASGDGQVQGGVLASLAWEGAG